VGELVLDDHLDQLVAECEYVLERVDAHGLMIAPRDGRCER
jgi:hypothetical protein